MKNRRYYLRRVYTAPGAFQWGQVDLERQHAWIHADQAKARRDLAVPLNTQAIAVLRRCRGRHPEYVFTYRGRALQGVENRTWKRAFLKAGITDFRWHDLRHTWASWYVQAATSLQTFMELGGWASYEMVLRYPIWQAFSYMPLPPTLTRTQDVPIRKS